MPKHKKRIGIFFGQDMQLDVMVERTSQVDQLTFPVVGCSDTGNQGGIGEPGRNLPRNIGRGSAPRNFLNAAIRQGDMNLLHVRVHLEGETLSLSAAVPAVQPPPAPTDQ